MKFLTAGVPLGTPRQSTEEGLKYLSSLGLDGMELEFVHGVRMKPQRAKAIGELARDLGLVLSVHAPYYINLNSKDPQKLKRSVQRLLDSARIGYSAGAFNICFHPGFYLKDPPDQVHIRIRDELKGVVSTLESEGVEVVLRPETMGKPSQYGSFDEVLKLSDELRGVMPCVDFAHIHARGGGCLRGEEDIAELLLKLKSSLGEEALKNMHIHMSGIAYGPKGERHHLNLEESDLPWKAILSVLKDFGADGIVVSESPNIEEDAIMMKDFWESL